MQNVFSNTPRRRTGELKRKEDIDRISVIRSIMFTFSVLHYQGETVKNTLLISVKQLLRLYRDTENPHYMEAAEQEILAYLCMGLSLPADTEIRDLCEKKQIRQQAMDLRMGKKVRLNKTQVRSLIGKWKTSRNTPMNVSQVVDDIIEKVSRREEGTWRYSYQRMHRGQLEREEYELVILPDETFFWDLNHFRFCSFIEEEKRKPHDTDSDSG